MLRTLLGLLALSCCALVARAAYDESLARTLIEHTVATDCPQRRLREWTCGGHCEQLPGFRVLAMPTSPQDEVFSYVGYYPATSHVVVALRGTDPSSVANWSANLSTRQVRPRWMAGRSVRVHSGWKRAADRLWPQVISVIDRVERSAPGEARFTLTGHSLGGAVATLLAARLSSRRRALRDRIQVYTFGAPRVGNPSFVSRLNWLVGEYYRVTYGSDVVARIPGRSRKWRHAGEEAHYEGGWTSEFLSYCRSDNQQCASDDLLPSLSDHMNYFGHDSQRCRNPDPAILEPRSFLALPDDPGATDFPDEETPAGRGEDGGDNGGGGGGGVGDRARDWWGRISRRF